MFFVFFNDESSPLLFLTVDDFRFLPLCPGPVISISFFVNVRLRVSPLLLVVNCSSCCLFEDGFRLLFTSFNGSYSPLFSKIVQGNRNSLGLPLDGIRTSSLRLTLHAFLFLKWGGAFSLFGAAVFIGRMTDFLLDACCG